MKTEADLRRLREAGKGAAQVLATLSRNIRPGISTKQLDDLAASEIRSLGMKPAFLGYNGYPANVCISVNEELVHGIPSARRILREGDIVSVDLGVFYRGFCGDTAGTYPVGNVSPEDARLMTVTSEALSRAIAKARAGNRLGDISWAVEEYAREAKLGVVRDYVGHGIGRRMHEEPPVPNYGRPGTGIRLRPGMVLAIEPMLNAGDWRVKVQDDGWTVVTVDGKKCAHFEHMVAITENGPEVLSVP